MFAGVNTYLYADANPIRYTDPLGLISFPIPGDSDEQGSSNQCENKPPRKDKCKNLRNFGRKQNG